MDKTTQPLRASGELLRVDPATGTLRSRKYRLSVIAGPDRGKEALLEATMVVGTQPGTGFVLTDPSVSRHHVELTALSHGVRVRDLDSTNGTVAAGMRISEVMIDLAVNDRARLTVGQTELAIAVDEEDLGKPRGTEAFGRALGTSEAMRAVFGILQRVAPTDASVLLLGETGTGKEVLAESIHQASLRQRGPFIVVDGAAVAPSLIESELFGHVKGAFTGAVSDRQGAFVKADGGTLFLDEIGDLPLDLQPKLLRVLERQTVKRLGEDEAREVSIRIIAATNCDLEAAVAAGRFRRDLYYRLAVVTVRVPPLRERPDDVSLLARHFIREKKGDDSVFSPALLERLRGYGWPGNARELRNVVQRLLAGLDIALGGQEPVADEKAAQEIDAALLPFKEAKEKLFEEFTRDYLTGLSERCAGNVARMARIAGINRSHLHRMMTRYGLKVNRE
jgi:two-component system, NtrC family, response regulator GlrR